MPNPATSEPAATAFKLEDAASYDTVVDDFDLLTSRYTQPIAEEIIGFAQLAPALAVLDVGCGTGVLTQLAAAEVGAAGRVVGFDLSEGMLAKAGALAAKNGQGGPIAFVRGDAERMPFPDSEFGAVVSLYALRHFPDPEQALREMYRCCRPGARTLVAVGSAPPFGSAAFVKAGLRVLSDRVLSLAGRAPLYATGFLDALITRSLGELDQTEHAAWTHGVSHYSGTVAELMRRVGYREIRSTWVGHVASLDSVEEFWTLQVTLSSYARKRIQMAPPDQVDSLRSEFNRICAGHLARGGRLVYRSGALATTGVRGTD